MLGVDEMPDTIQLRGRVFKFVGVSLRASKNPIIAEYNGEQYRLNKDAVKEALTGGAVSQSKPRRRKTYFSEVPIGKTFRLLNSLGQPTAGVHRKTGKYEYVIVSPGTSIDGWPATWDGDKKLGVMFIED